MRVKLGHEQRSFRYQFRHMHGVCVSIEIEAQPQSGAHIVNDGTCDDYFAEPMTFHYAYTTDYDGHGPSMMYYSADYFQWFAWIRDGDTIYETPQSILEGCVFI